MLAYALMYSRPEIVQTLLETEAFDLEAALSHPVKHHSMTIMEAATIYRETLNLELLQLLVKCGIALPNINSDQFHMMKKKALDEKNNAFNDFLEQHEKEEIPLKWL